MDFVGEVEEKVVVENLTKTVEEIGVDVFPAENLVYVGAVAVEFFGEPLDVAPLFVDHFANQTAYVHCYFDNRLIRFQFQTLL